jgi:murein DD-endopeptidase MepM/ murein hydrolase activator NlpD
MKRGFAFAMLFVAGTARAQTFTYDPPGQLSPATAGTGLAEQRALAATMRFPIESAPAYANSQVWGHGGYLLGSGSECDAENFSYPWHDNFCEKRDWEMPLCPGGTGHQGQDIRAASCKNLTHWTVATVDGTIISASGPGTGVAGYQVLLVGADGTRYRYLHMGNVLVKTGDTVKRGQRLGMVSREFNGTPTTVHLHFDLMQNVAPHGLVFVSPYMSLVGSYERLLGIADAGTDGGTKEDAKDGGAAVETSEDAPDAGASEEADDGRAEAEFAVTASADAGCAIGRTHDGPPAFVAAVVVLALARLTSRASRSERRRSGSPSPRRLDEGRCSRAAPEGSRSSSWSTSRASPSRR